MLSVLKNRNAGVLLVVAVMASIHSSDLMAADREVAPTQLQIRLRPSTNVMHPNVRLTDIATFFSNGQMCTLKDLPRNLQVQLHQVHVVSLTHERHVATVSREDLNKRVQQLRPQLGPCELVGPGLVSVSIGELSPPDVASDRPFRFASATTNSAPATSKIQLNSALVTDLSLERAIRDELARQFGMIPDDLQVRLLQSVINASQNLKGVENPVVQVTAPAQFPYGRSSLLIRILDGQRIAMMQSVTVDVRLRQTMLMTRRPIATGAEIEESMLKEEIRFTDRQSDQLTADDVVGMIAARSFRANEMVTWNQLRAASTATLAQSPDLVKAREAVQVIAKRKGMTIVIPSAEALQSGRKGQLIRVRNLRSNKVISARVLSAGTVEIVL